jgi:hypothetical protein
MQIRHLQHKDIDYARWDECITQSHNQLTYAHSWYLDIVSPNWEALVTENYEFIMPLPIKRKYGIPYLVQPIFIQQLGVFSKHAIPKQIIELFIKQIRIFSYELNLNDKNYHIDAVEYPNYILDLNKPYTQIASHYSKNTIRNIEKATKANLTIQTELPVNEFISFYHAEDKNYQSSHKSIAEKLLKKGITENKITLYGVLSVKNKLIATLCILDSNDKITYLLPISSNEGKSSSAMFFLIDFIIRKEANKPVKLDFEGSSIEGIARFYKGFGAINQPYYILKQFRPSFLTGKTSK